MADPVGFSAAIVGLVVPALHGVRLLLNDLGKIKNAPEALQRLREDVNSIGADLRLIKDIEEHVWTSLGTAVAGHSRATIESCEVACDTIRGDLQRWTKRSKGGTLSWVDRVNIGFFRDHQLKAHSGRLHAYRLTFNSIVGTATLYSSIRNSQMTDEIRQSIASRQKRIVAAGNSTQAEMSVVQRTLGEVQSHQANGFNHEGRNDDDGDDDDLDNTVATLTDLMNTLTLSQTLLGELLSETETIEANKADKGVGTINVTFGNNYKGMQIGQNYGSIPWNSN